MSGPTDGLEKFKLFPPEIWSSIALFLPGEQLGRLKLTGSKYLWSKLTKDYIVKSIILGEGGLLFQKVPAFLYEFPHLETFALANKSDHWWDPWWPTVEMVPSTVKKLIVLSGNRNSRCFLSGRFIENVNSVIAFEKIVPNLEELETDCQPFTYTTYPPTLTKLTIASWDGDLLLPKSLRHLVVDSSINLNSLRSLELPPGIETISAYSIENIELLLFSLPPTFQSLTIKSVEGVDAVKNLARLPKNLKSLISISFEHDDEQEIPSNALLLAVPSLTRLTALFMPYANWPYLPETLTDLDLQVIPFMSSPLVPPPQGKRKSHPIYALPTSITRLALCFSELTFLDTCFDYHSVETEESTPPMFPASLTFLHISDAQLSVDLAKQLPTSLKSLFVQIIDEAVCEVLPKGLTQLNCPSVLSFNEKFINALPRSLTSLSVGYQGSGFDSTTGDRLYIQENNEATLNIPETILLPPHLTSVSLYSLGSINDAFVKHHIHPLKSLQEFETSGPLTDLSIPLLPRRLTTLQLSQTNEITGKYFAQLPPMLTHLSLASTSQVVDSDIAQLPRSLTFLSLPLATLLTNGCAKDLPQSLRYLSLMTNQNITEDVFSDLPATLRRSSSALSSFQVAGWSISYGQIKRNRRTKPMYAY